MCVCVYGGYKDRREGRVDTSMVVGILGFVTTGSSVVSFKHERVHFGSNLLVS